MDRPIIFSGAMVQALLAGRKTQTRRLATSPLRKCEVGDRLYVRESIYFWSSGHDCEVTFAADGAARQTGPNTGAIPDTSLPGYFRMVDQSIEKRGRISRPSIHMPRWASRLTLTVEDVKVEPLQAISEEDSRAEGLRLVRKTFPPMLGCEDALREREVYEWPGGWSVSPVKAYEALWSSLHTAEGQRWEDNPEVVALTFSVVRGNIDAISSPAAGR